MMYKGKRQRMHPHRKQGRAVAAAVLGRPVFYASLAARGGSDTHTCSYFFLCGHFH